MVDPRSALRVAAGRAWDAARTFLATRRGKLIAGGTAAVLVIGAGGGAVFAATRTDDGRYRTATAALGTVAETLALTGQVSSATSASAAFQVAGTVGDVLVELGDAVAAGQELATLDTDDLDAAVTTAEDALASAEQQLEDDLDAQSGGSSTPAASGDGSSRGSASNGAPGTGGSSGGSVPGGSSGGSTPSPTPSPSTSTGAGDGGSGSVSDDPAVVAAAQAVTDAQAALLARYETATAAQERSRSAAAEAQETCAPFLDATLSDDGTIETDEDAVAASDALSATQDLLTACQAAISDTLDEQSATSTAQDALNDSARSLDDAVTALQNAIADAASGDSTSPDADTSALRSTGRSGLNVVTASAVFSSRETVAADDPSGGSGGNGSTSSATVTAQRILADRAQIDLAEAELAVARQNRQFATLTSPIAGTVVDISLAAGDEVTAGSATAVVTVQGAGGYVVQSTVTLSKIAKIAVGQTAEVALPAFGQTYTATVTSVGILNESTTSTPAYTVTLGIDAGGDAIRIGATAQAALSLSTAEDVLTVPTSAVTITANAASVVVLRDGQERTVSVEVGAVGTELTEVTSGLDVGDRVVLADLTKAVTSGDDTASTSLSDLGGGNTRGFPTGGDIPSGGFPGAPPGN